MAFIYYDNAFPQARYSLAAKDILFEKDSPYQHISIIENEIFGKVLILDDLFQTSTFDEHFYHEMLVHPAIIKAQKIKNVLIVGGGDGGTARRVLQHREVESVRMVEIDSMVVEACREHMPSIGENAWDDPRLSVIIDDGKEYIKYLKENAPESIDVIIIDGSDPVGPSEVLSQREFYEDCHQVLSKDGVLVTQSGSPYLMKDSFCQIVNVLSDIFVNTSSCFGPVPLYPGGLWSYTIASKNAECMDTKFYRFGLIHKSCQYYNEEVHEASFNLGYR